MYKIVFAKKAADFLRKLDKIDLERVSKRINELQISPELGVTLTGNLTGLWKLRIGDYRVIYQIKNEELIILILKIGHRKNIYD